MTVSRPSAADIDAAARHFGFNLDADARRDYLAAVGSSLHSYDVVDELYDEFARPHAPERGYQFPEPGHNPLGAWYVTAEIASGARGPLSGRAVAIKDNIAVAGIPMMNGSHAVEGFVPSRDATVVERLLAARETPREAGGSSSGSGALVAAGEVDLALGGDQGGSIRIPASLCGVVGLKPTHGLIPYTGAFPIERTIDHLGPITRTVADAALLLNVLAGPDGWDPRQPAEIAAGDYRAALTGDVGGLRIGILTEGFGQHGSLPEVDDLVR